MIIRKSPNQIEGIRLAGQIVAETIAAMAKLARVGVTTADLEQKAKEVFDSYGATSAFLGYRPKRNMPAYPAYVCISVNDEIVHGIPGKRVIQSGDIISVDVGVRYRGFVGDSAATYIVEGADRRAIRIAWITYNALHKGIAAAKIGAKVSDISYAIQSFVEANGYSVVRDLVGHGVGIQLHEEPQVPNFVDKTNDATLLEGMTIAIEPMICEMDYHTIVGADGWTTKTKDGGLAAHFEHTIAITAKGPRILTLLKDDKEPYVPPRPSSVSQKKLQLNEMNSDTNYKHK